MTQTLSNVNGTKIKLHLTDYLCVKEMSVIKHRYEKTVYSDLRSPLN